MLAIVKFPILRHVQNNQFKKSVIGSIAASLLYLGYSSANFLFQRICPLILWKTGDCLPINVNATCQQTFSSLHGVFLATGKAYERCYARREAGSAHYGDWRIFRRQSSAVRKNL